MLYTSFARRRASKSVLALTLAALIMLLLSACNGDPQLQQQASQKKVALDSAIAHAQRIGVPGYMLQPIISQEDQLNNTSSPVGLINDQPMNDYFSNLVQRYALLAVEANGLITQATQQLDFQASQDLQKLENALAERQAQNFVEARTFANQLTQYQTALANARYPRDYIQIGENALNSTQALHLMGPAYSSLTALQQVTQQLQASHLDVTALNQQQQDDLQAFRAATTPADFSQLIDEINAQLQETTVYSTQAIPFVGAAKLKEFSADIDLLKKYGQNPTTFQQRLQADQRALTQAKGINDFLKVSAQIDSDT